MRRLHQVSPKTAGIGTVIGGVLLAVVGGFLIAHPPASILGALLLVPATLLVSIGCVWMLRRNWNEPWPPDMHPSQARLLRIRRVVMIGTGILLPLAIAGGVYSAVQGEWWWLVYSLFLTVNGAYNLRVYRTLLRQKDVTASGRPLPRWRRR